MQGSYRLPLSTQVFLNFYPSLYPLLTHLPWPFQYSLTPGGAMVKNLPANAGDTRAVNSILGLGRAPGGGHGSPLQYSCLENPMDKEAWQATVYRVQRVGHNGACTILPEWCQSSHIWLSYSSMSLSSLFENDKSLHQTSYTISKQHFAAGEVGLVFKSLQNISQKPTSNVISLSG